MRLSRSHVVPMAARFSIKIQLFAKKRVNCAEMQAFSALWQSSTSIGTGFKHSWEEAGQPAEQYPQCQVPFADITTDLPEPRFSGVEDWHQDRTESSALS